MSEPSRADEQTSSISAGFQWLEENAVSHGVRATEVAAKRISPKAPKSLDVQIRRSFSRRTDHIFYSVRYVLNASDQDGKVVSVITVAVRASYFMGDNRPDITDADIALFGTARALRDMSPLVQENIFSLASRVELDAEWHLRSFSDHSAIRSRNPSTHDPENSTTDPEI